MPRPRSFLLMGAMLLAAPARAAEPPEHAEVLFTGDAADRLLGKLLPVTLDVPADKDKPASAAVRLVEARYCGAASGGRGRVLGVVRPDGAAAAPPLLTGPRDCKDKLDEILKRAAPPPEAGAVAIVEALAAWAPWQLRLSIGDIAVGGEGGAALGAALARAKAAGPIQTIDTAGLQLSPPDGTPPQALDLAVSFLKANDGFLIGATPAGRAAGRAPAPPTEAGNDAAVAASYGLLNRLITLYTDRSPLTLDVGGETVDVRELQVLGSEGSATVRGRATPRSIRETVRVSIEAAGADLKVAQVRAAPELEDCGAMSAFAALGCRARNAARTSAANALASEMTSRYRGQTLRSLTPPPPSAMQLGQRRYNVRLTPTRIRATGDGLVTYGRADVEPAAE